MKKALLPVALLFAWKSQAQQSFAFEPVSGRFHSRTIYATYYNKCNIVAEEMDCDSFSVTSCDFNVIKDKSCFYYLQAKARVHSGTIYITDNRTGTTIDSMWIHVDDKIPLPVIDRSGKTGENGVISLPLDSIVIRPNSDYDWRVVPRIGFYFVSCIVDVVKDGQVVYSEYMRQTTFSEAVKEHWWTSKRDDQLNLRSIVVKDANGNFYDIPDKVIKVQNY